MPHTRRTKTFRVPNTPWTSSGLKRGSSRAGGRTPAEPQSSILPGRHPETTSHLLGSGRTALLPETSPVVSVPVSSVQGAQRAKDCLSCH